MASKKINSIAFFERPLIKDKGGETSKHWMVKDLDGVEKFKYKNKEN